MAALTLKHALAAPFSLAGESFTFKLSGSSGTTRTATIAATTNVYNVLGASTNDALRILAAAMTAVLPGGVSVTVVMNSSSKVVVTLTGDTFNTCNLPSSAIGAILGFTSAVPVNAASVTADYPPKYLATFVEVTGTVWTPVGQNTFAETSGGVSYGYQASTLLWSAEPTFGFIPLSPSFNDSNTLQTPFHPSDANLGSLGSHAVPWGVSDLLRVAGGKTLHYAQRNFQDLLTSTSELYYNVSIAGKDLATPRVTRQTGAWDKYVRWTVALLRQTSPTGTRA